MSPAPAPPKRQLNRALAALAVVVMLVALGLLGWLRHQTISDLKRDVLQFGAAFTPEALLRGPGGNSWVRVDATEAIVRRGLQSPYVADAVVSVTLPGRPELFVVPFTFGVDHAGDPQAALAGYQPLPLGEAAHPFGRLYLKVDRSKLDRINMVIGALALAILLVLVALLARVWSQESTLTRTTIELGERRRELIRLERLALAGELSAGLLHDLRKPVLNIRHGLDEMQEALGDFAPAAAPLDELKRNARLFFEILGESQVERFVRSDRVGEEYVDIGPILDYSFSLVRYEQRGVEVERHLGEGLPPIYAHPFRLIQLFSNLILNAYQALGGRGRLRVDATAAEGGVRVRLTDNGPGIPPEVQERIFEPFFTTKPEGEGTGLGLSICRLIVEDLGGQLGVESRPGGPTAFIIWLPGEAEPTPKETA